MQFFIVFVAIVLGSQSAGQFLAHSLGTQRASPGLLLEPLEVD